MNSFLLSAQSIIQQVVGINPKMGSPKIVTTPFDGKDLVALINVETEDSKGYVGLTLNKDTACKVASVMMGGMSIVSLNELSKSAIGEVANMICGHAATNVAGYGLKMHIGSPILLQGKEMVVSVNADKVISIPLRLSDMGSIAMSIALKQKSKEGFYE